MMAQKLHKNLGYTSTRTYLKVAEDHLLPNYPIAIEDVLSVDLF